MPSSSARRRQSPYFRHCLLMSLACLFFHAITFRRLSPDAPSSVFSDIRRLFSRLHAVRPRRSYLFDHADASIRLRAQSHSASAIFVAMLCSSMTFTITVACRPPAQMLSPGSWRRYRRFHHATVWPPRHDAIACFHLSSRFRLISPVFQPSMPS